MSNESIHLFKSKENLTNLNFWKVQ